MPTTSGSTAVPPPMVGSCRAVSMREIGHGGNLRCRRARWSTCPRHDLGDVADVPFRLVELDLDRDTPRLRTDRNGRSVGLECHQQGQRVSSGFSSAPSSVA